MCANKRLPEFPEPTCCGLRRWFRQMHAAGFLYHPDDLAETIICIDTGDAKFTPEECTLLNAAIESMFAVHGDVVYTVCLYFASKSLGIKQVRHAED